METNGYVNMDRKLLKNGGRTAEKISKDDFLNKLCDLQNKYGDDEKYSYEDFSLDNLSPSIFWQYSKIYKDFKIQFDDENSYIDDNDRLNSYGDGPTLLGINEMDNGLIFLGCVSGGDWEYPVFYIIYWDGKSLRGYVPSYGNCINLDFKTAFGSEEDSEHVDEDDILKKPKYKNFNHNHYDYTGFYLKRENVSIDSDMQFNWDAMKEDIMSRIIVKDTIEQPYSLKKIDLNEFNNKVDNMIKAIFEVRNMVECDDTSQECSKNCPLLSVCKQMNTIFIWSSLRKILPDSSNNIKKDE